MAAILQAIQSLGESTKVELSTIRDEQRTIAEGQTAIFAQLTARLDVVESRLDAFITSANEQLSAITSRLNGLGKEVTTATTTYADALKSGLPTSGATTPITQGTPIAQLCSINLSSSASRQNATSNPHVVIDVAAAEHREILTMDKPGEVRRRIDEALHGQEATKDIKCEGISRSARDNNKFKVFFKDDKIVTTDREHDR